MENKFIRADGVAQELSVSKPSLSQMQNALENAPEYQLPEPQGFMTAKSYKSKVVVPLIKRLKSLIKTLMVRCFQAIDDYQRLNQTNASLYRMTKTIFEEMGGTYTQVGDYFPPPFETARKGNTTYWHLGAATFTVSQRVSQSFPFQFSHERKAE